MEDITDTMDDTIMGETPFDPGMIFGQQGPQTTSVEITLSADVSVHLTIITDGLDTTVTGNIEGTDVASPDELSAAVEVLKRLL